MGNIFGGSSTNTASSSQSPPAQVQANYQGLVNRATTAANTPYTPYPGEQVAPLSDQTQAGLGGVSQYAGAAQPFYSTAESMTQGAAAAPTSDTLAPYMNPFTSSVVNATQAELQNQNQQQAQFLNSQNIGAGAFGGDRAGISQDVLAGQQALAEAPTIAGLNEQNFNQALAEFNQQQQTKLAAAGQYANLGLGGQQAGLTGAQTQMTAGMLPQEEQQAIDQSLQNAWATGQAYPFQTTDFLGNIIEGTGSQAGGTSTTSTPGPSGTSQAIGAGIFGLGALGQLGQGASGLGSIVSSLGALLPVSDIRLKENVEPIGKTFDGQTIHKFNFKGDPRTQIGLLAHEVEQSHPHAVHEGFGGLMHVDYDAATRESERAGFQTGGTPYDIGAGRFSPAGALQDLGVGEGGTYGGAFGAGQLRFSPGGTLFGRGSTSGVPEIAPSGLGGPSPAGGATHPSPLSPMPAPARQPIQQSQARGGRIGHGLGGVARRGFQSGGIQNVANYGYLDTATPIAIAQGTGSPDPASGISNILAQNVGVFGGTGSGGSGAIGPLSFTQIGTDTISPSQPNLAGAPAGSVFRPMDYLNPMNDFQTANAEAGLAGLIAQPAGKDTQSSKLYSSTFPATPTSYPLSPSAPAPSAPAPSSPAPSAPAPSAPAPSAPSRGLGGVDQAFFNQQYLLSGLGGHEGHGGHAEGGRIGLGRLGRPGFQDGGDGDGTTGGFGGAGGPAPAPGSGTTTATFGSGESVSTRGFSNAPADGGGGGGPSGRGGGGGGGGGDGPAIGSHGTQGGAVGGIGSGTSPAVTNPAEQHDLALAALLGVPPGVLTGVSTATTPITVSPLGPPSDAPTQTIQDLIRNGVSPNDAITLAQRYALLSPTLGGAAPTPGTTMGFPAANPTIGIGGTPQGTPAPFGMTQGPAQSLAATIARGEAENAAQGGNDMGLGPHATEAIASGQPSAAVRAAMAVDRGVSVPGFPYGVTAVTAPNFNPNVTVPGLPTYDPMQARQDALANQRGFAGVASASAGEGGHPGHGGFWTGGRMRPGFQGGGGHGNFAPVADLGPATSGVSTRQLLATALAPSVSGSPTPFNMQAVPGGGGPAPSPASAMAPSGGFGQFSGPAINLMRNMGYSPDQIGGALSGGGGGFTPRYLSNAQLFNMMYPWATRAGVINPYVGQGGPGGGGAGGSAPGGTAPGGTAPGGGAPGGAAPGGVFGPAGGPSGQAPGGGGGGGFSPTGPGGYGFGAGLGVSANNAATGPGGYGFGSGFGINANSNATGPGGYGFGRGEPPGFSGVTSVGSTDAPGAIGTTPGFQGQGRISYSDTMGPGVFGVVAPAFGFTQAGKDVAAVTADPAAYSDPGQAAFGPGGMGYGESTAPDGTSSAAPDGSTASASDGGDGSASARHGGRIGFQDGGAPWTVSNNPQFAYGQYGAGGGRGRGEPIITALNLGPRPAPAVASAPPATVSHEVHHTPSGPVIVPKQAPAYDPLAGKPTGVPFYDPLAGDRTGAAVPRMPPRTPTPLPDPEFGPPTRLMKKFPTSEPPIDWGTIEPEPWPNLGEGLGAVARRFVPPWLQAAGRVMRPTPPETGELPAWQPPMAGRGLPPSGPPRFVSGDENGMHTGGRIGFNLGGANAGVMGQVPLAGAIAYAPPGQSLNQRDSQGATPGGGFGALFDVSNRRQREGFRGGGLANQIYIPQPINEATLLAELLQGGGGGGRGSGPPPIPTMPQQQPNPISSALQGLSGQRGSSGSQQASTAGSGGAAATTYDITAGLNNPDFAFTDAPDLVSVSDAELAGLSAADLGFGLGGIVRSRYADGGSTLDTDALASAAPASAAPAGGQPTSVGDAGGAPTRQQVLDYNAAIAPKYGNDPKVVTSVLSGEMGTKDPYEVGDAGSSFGPWQFHVGGINPNMPHPGMGDEYRAVTGHDPNDPHYWQEQSDFAQRNIAKGGLTPWQTTMNKLGYNRWSARGGDGGAPAAVAQAGSGAPSGTGLAAIDPQTKMQMAMDDAERPPDQKLMPGHLSDTLMMMGAAMMAGTSPHAGVNIGQGLMKGMEYYQNQRQLDRQWLKDEAEIQNYGAEARYRNRITDLETQKLDWEVKKYKYDHDYGVWVANGGVGDPPPAPSMDVSSIAAPPAPAPKAPMTAGPAGQTAPVATAAPTTAPTIGRPPPLGAGLPKGGVHDDGTPILPGEETAAATPGKPAEAPPAPAAVSAAPDTTKPAPAPPAATQPAPKQEDDPEIAPGVHSSDVIDSENAVLLQKKIDLLSRQATLYAANPSTAALAATATTKLDALQRQMNALMNAPILHLKNNKTIVNPAVVEAAGAKKGGEEAASQASTQRAQENKEVTESEDLLQRQLNMVKGMRQLIRDGFDPNALSPPTAEVLRYAQALGMDVGKQPTMKGIFDKFATNDTWQALKEQKGAVRVAEINQATKMMPDSSKTAGENRAILALQQAVLERELKYATEYQDWSAATPQTVSPMGFQGKWYFKSENNIEGFNKKADREFWGERPKGVPDEAEEGNDPVTNRRTGFRAVDPNTGKTTYYNAAGKVVGVE